MFKEGAVAIKKHRTRVIYILRKGLSRRQNCGKSLVAGINKFAHREWQLNIYYLNQTSGKYLFF